MNAGELKKQLENIPDDAEVIVGDNTGTLDYYVLKTTGAYGLNKANEFAISVVGLANAMENVSSLLDAED